MKHNMKVTLFLLLLFFTAQVVGLYLLNTIAEVRQTETGTEVEYPETVVGRPEIEGQGAFLYILIMILVGTALLLLLIKFRMFKVWKAWFFLAVFGSILISLSVIIPLLYALIIAGVVSYLKLYKPNVLIHNATEIFMYSGIAILLVPLLDVFWMIMLLIAISIYDAIAVWKSKHMIVMAKAQAEEKMFAGLFIPYIKEKPKKIEKSKSIIKLKLPKGFKEEGVKSAILGGGDIAFPLLFAGSVMTWLIQSGVSKQVAYFQSLIIPVFAGLALFGLLMKSEKDKFYPAMPFISLGCLIGYGIIYLI